MSKLISALTNETLTENGARTYKSTLNGLLDFFALGGAMRNRSDADVIDLFMKAYKEDATLAVQMLFYFRDVRGGQGERRLFRVIFKHLENVLTREQMLSLLPIVADYGRYDDLYCLVGTRYEDAVFSLFKAQLVEDIPNEFPSLLAKWLKSENASSQKTKALGTLTRKKLGLTSKQYRKTLSALRKRINLVETLMTNGQWDEIDYAKLPSKAGLQYRNAFMRHDGDRYTDFMNPVDGKKVSVNASTLYPYEIVEKVSASRMWADKTLDATYNAYWANIKDYLKGNDSKALAVIDVSGSMRGIPMEVAVSLGLYMAERNEGIFRNNFITFSQNPQLVQLSDNQTFCEKVRTIKSADWGYNTNLKAVFDLLLNKALKYNLSQSDLPETLYIISDMEFDSAVGYDGGSLMESIAKRWNSRGYQMPHLVFWNVDARQNNLPMVGQGNYSLVSGFSPSIFEMIASQKTAEQLMIDTISQERYAKIGEIMKA